MIGAWSLAALLGSVNAGCLNFRPPPAPVANTASAGAPAEVWSEDLGRGFTPNLAANGRTVYLGGYDRKVFAVAGDSGRVRWTRRLGGPVVAGILRAGDRLYVATARPEQKVHAIAADSGRVRWSASAGQVITPLALAGGVVLAQDSEGRVTALDTADGRVRWQRELGPGRAAPVGLADGSALVSTVDSLFLLDAASGEILARRPAPGVLLAPWVQHGEHLVGGTTDSLVLAVDPATLETRWRVRLDAPVFDPPLPRGDTLYVATRVGSLHRIVPGSAAGPAAERLARLGWAVSAGPVAWNDLLLLGGADGQLRALRHDGSEAWRLQVWQPIPAPPVPLDAGLLVLGGDGDLHLFR